jgi:hypothetical protein
MIEMSFILSIFFDYFYVCVCGSRLDKGAIKKRRKSRTKGCETLRWHRFSAPSQMRAFRLVPAATGAASNKMDGRVFCTAPEDDIPPLLASFSFFQAVADIRPPTLPY